jgi:hypothetical protein
MTLALALALALALQGPLSPGGIPPKKLAAGTQEVMPESNTVAIGSKPMISLMFERA